MFIFEIIGRTLVVLGCCTSILLSRRTIILIGSRAFRHTEATGAAIAVTVVLKFFLIDSESALHVLFVDLLDYLLRVRLIVAHAGSEYTRTVTHYF